MSTPSPTLGEAFPGKKALDPTHCGWGGTAASNQGPHQDGGGVVQHGRDSLPTIFGAGNKSHRATRMRPAGQR
jgi:hypothetical protein